MLFAYNFIASHVWIQYWILYLRLVRLFPCHQSSITNIRSANVIAEDLFEHTFSNDPENTSAWNRFRLDILQYGGSRDEGEILESYLGRKPSPTALIRSLGVNPITKGVP